MRTDEKREMLRRKHPDIEFQTDKGTKVKLQFDKNEYRAYRYDAKFESWYEMKLGGLDPSALMDYISKHF